jgi:hypothetical protein
MNNLLCAAVLISKVLFENISKTWNVLNQVVFLEDDKSGNIFNKKIPTPSSIEHPRE